MFCPFWEKHFPKKEIFFFLPSVVVRGTSGRMEVSFLPFVLRLPAEDFPEKTRSVPSERNPGGTGPDQLIYFFTTSSRV